MADVLKLLLDLDVKAKGLGNLDKGLGRLQVTAVAAEDKVKRVERATSFLDRTLANFTADAAARALSRLASGAVRMGGEMLTAMGDAQRTESAFRQLFGAQEGAQILEYLEQIAKHTEFDDGPLKDFALGLRKVGVAAKDIPDMLAAGLDIASFSKDKQAGLQDAMNAFESLQTRGELNFRVLGNLGITKEELLKDLSKQSGLGMEAVEKELGKGLRGRFDLDTLRQTMFRAITGKTGKDLGAAGVERGKGLTAQMERLRNVPSNLFEEMSKLPIAGQLADIFGALAQRLGPEGDIGKALTGALGTVLTDIGKFLASVDLEGLSRDFLRFWEVAKAGGMLFIGTIKEIVRLFDLVGSGIGTAVAAIYLFGEGVVKLVDHFGTFLGETAAKLYLGAIDLGTRLWQGFKDGILGGLGRVGEAVGDLAHEAVSRLKGFLGIRSPSKVFEQLGAMSGEGFARGVAGSEARIDTQVSRTFDVTAPAAHARASAGALGRGPIAVTVPITVNWTGGDARGAEELARQIRDLIPGQLQQALEQLSLEVA